MTDAERALLRQDELEAKKWREENGSTYLVGSNQRTWHDSDVAAYVNYRLAAARAGERENLEKACKVMCVQCRDEDHVWLNVGNWVHWDDPYCVEADGNKPVLCAANSIRKLMAELFPVAPMEEK